MKRKRAMDFYDLFESKDSSDSSKVFACCMTMFDLEKNDLDIQN